LPFKAFEIVSIGFEISPEQVRYNEINIKYMISESNWYGNCSLYKM